MMTFIVWYLGLSLAALLLYGMWAIAKSAMRKAGLDSTDMGIFLAGCGSLALIAYAAT